MRSRTVVAMRVGHLLDVGVMMMRAEVVDDAPQHGRKMGDDDGGGGPSSLSIPGKYLSSYR